MATLEQVLVAEAATARRVSVLASVAAGLLVGMAECLFFAVTLSMFQIQLLTWQWFGYAAYTAVSGVAFALVVAAPVLAGWAFALLLGRSGSAWWRTALTGPTLLLASMVGVVIAATLEPLGIQSPGPQLVLVFRVAFVLASATAALLCTFAVARLLGIPNGLNVALLTAAATGVTYLVVVLVLDQLPGWRVGGGDKAMVRVAMLGNLLAGTVGGSIAFGLLSRWLRTAHTE